MASKVCMVDLVLGSGKWLGEIILKIVELGDCKSMVQEGEDRGWLLMGLVNAVLWLSRKSERKMARDVEVVNVDRRQCIC